MKDPALNIRTAVAEALAGLTVDGRPVVVYDDLAEDTATFPRVILMDVIGSDNDNSKCGWGGDWSQTIKISDRFTGGVSKNRIDDISNQIMEILVQTAPSAIIDLSPDFSVWNVSGNVVGNQRYQDGVTKYVDKNIRITFSLTEN